MYWAVTKQFLLRLTTESHNWASTSTGLVYKCLHLVMVEVMQDYFAKPENNYASLEFLS